MKEMLEIWTPEAALVATGAGVFLVYLSIIGSNMVTNALRHVSAQITHAGRETGDDDRVDVELLEVTRRALLLDLESTAILFKVIQSVGLGFHLGFMSSVLSFALRHLHLSPAVFPGPETWLANLAFFLMSFGTLFVVIAYCIHRLADRKLRGLQEWLHLVRLRYLVKC